MGMRLRARTERSCGGESNGLRAHSRLDQMSGRKLVSNRSVWNNPPMLTHRCSSRRLVQLVSLIAVFVAAIAMLPASAGAAPEDVVAGAGKEWFTGSSVGVSGTTRESLGRSQTGS